MSAFAGCPRPPRRARQGQGEEESEEARARSRHDRVQHAADRDPLPAGAGRGDGLLRQLDHPDPAERRPLRQRLLPGSQGWPKFIL